jgi:hypothetical protein
MPGGALIVLAARGPQDQFFYDNLANTFWMQVYSKHTPFAIESVQQTWSGGAALGQRAIATISRNGDLLTKLYLQVTLNQSGTDFAYVNKLGHRLIEEVELEIGGHRIDHRDGRYMDLWDELTQPAEKEMGEISLMGVDRSADVDYSNSMQVFPHSKTLFIPIHFWFTETWGNALPLVALQHHEVKVSVTFAKAKDLVLKVDSAQSYSLAADKRGVPVGSRAVTPLVAYHSNSVAANGTKVTEVNQSPSMLDFHRPDTFNHDLGFTCELYADYVYLDKEERTRIATHSQQQIITQVQFQGAEQVASSVVNYKMHFNHPVKCLLWSFEKDLATNNSTTIRTAGHHDTEGHASNDAFVTQPFWNSYKEVVDYSLTEDNTFRGTTWYRPNSSSDTQSAHQPFNSKGATSDDALNPWDSVLLRLNGNDYQSERPAQYHSRVVPHEYFPRIPKNNWLGALSFALSPASFAPSGTVNMSRIDHATLQLKRAPSKTVNGKLYVYAVGYNVVTIRSGMLGLTYAS